MKIHEFQGKDLLRRQGIPVPVGAVAATVEEAVDIAEGLGGFPLMVKAQIQAGGRGKGGGVVKVSSAAELEAAAGKILGMRLITAQTGPGGKLVRRILIEQGTQIVRELYLSILPDRRAKRLTLLLSRVGGTDIEKTAASAPDQLVKIGINPLTGLQPFHIREAAFGLAVPSSLSRPFSDLLNRLYTFFVKKDCSLLEINPLVITGDEQLMALDAKLEFDPNALFRHSELRALYDEDEEDPRETAAGKVGLNYIRLSGNIGSMVNGAGLAMATMDMIETAGAKAANFLDVGGGADAEMIAAGFQLIADDPMVEAILVNIFGGILRCDILARGMVEAARRTQLKIPVIIRMAGTNAEEARKILTSSGLNLLIAADLKETVAMIKKLSSKGA